MGLLVFLCVIRVPLQKRVCSECFLNEGTDDDFPLCVLQEAFDAKSDEERKEFGVSIVQRFLRSQVWHRDRKKLIKQQIFFLFSGS